MKIINGLITFLALFAGLLLAAAALNQWTTPLVQSLQSSEATGYWLLARAAGVVAYTALSGSVLLGLLLSSKAARQAGFAPLALSLHDFLALLGVLLTLFHALILLGDAYLQPQWWQLLLPFALPHRQWLWLGWGQVGFYLFVLILLAYYGRRHLGMALWRWVHPLAFAAYALITLHGLLAGSDTRTPFMLTLYAAINTSILFWSLYRLWVLWPHPKAA
ncbi:hypothetical protein [Paralysiella testudinis]|uniref:Ferric oxidoreductase domain-containing protein n=1 Tax=Paralysiella testudinis TaxID=2809020 RepID=A0A892ZJI8_9NEIS|nr:hypothetical protein [Paralysiella testudinis]QRQ81876.1 hypothetical protein JQU52_14660 [Paralysiella testudinis]